MKIMITLSAAALLLCAQFHCSGDKTLHYGPVLTELTGKVVTGKSEHPNGSMMEFYLLELDKPVAVSGDPSNDLNEEEKNVKEVQLVLKRPDHYKKIRAMTDRRVTVRGALFHGHTAWHVRPVLMDVNDIPVSGSR